MNYQHVLIFIENSIEFLGVSIIFVGIILGLFKAIGSYISQGDKEIYTRVRKDIGRAILLGLEILIAVDIIKTVTTELTLDNTINLGLIVLIRTILSLSLELEIEKKLPWKH